MALRCMSHVLYRQTSVNFFNKKYQAGIRALSLYSCILAARQFNTMASKYIPVEKGTPNSTDYRVYFSEYWQYQLCAFISCPFFFSLFSFCSSFSPLFRSLSHKWIVSHISERAKKHTEKRQKTHIFYLSSNSKHCTPRIVLSTIQCAFHWLLHKDVSHTTESWKKIQI